MCNIPLGAPPARIPGRTTVPSASHSPAPGATPASPFSQQGLVPGALVVGAGERRVVPVVSMRAVVEVEGRTQRVIGGRNPVVGAEGRARHPGEPDRRCLDLHNGPKARETSSLTEEPGLSGARRWAMSGHWWGVRAWRCLNPGQGAQDGREGDCRTAELRCFFLSPTGCWPTLSGIQTLEPRIACPTRFRDSEASAAARDGESLAAHPAGSRGSLRPSSRFVDRPLPTPGESHSVVAIPAGFLVVAAFRVVARVGASP